LFKPKILPTYDELTAVFGQAPILQPMIQYDEETGMDTGYVEGHWHCLYEYRGYTIYAYFVENGGVLIFDGAYIF